MGILVPIAALILPCILTYFIIRAGNRALVIVILLALAASMVWGIWKAQQYTGYDGLGYALFAVLMAAPAILGTLLGWLMGWIANRRTRAGLARREASE